MTGWSVSPGAWPGWAGGSAPVRPGPSFGRKEGAKPRPDGLQASLAQEAAKRQDAFIRAQARDAAEHATVALRSMSPKPRLDAQRLGQALGQAEMASYRAAFQGLGKVASWLIRLVP